jgi:hypothetical protein
MAAAAPPSALWFTTRGAGVATLVLLTATVVLGIATSLRWEGRATPRFVIASLHRNLSLLAILLLALHIATSVLDPFAGITVLDAIVPFAGRYRTFWLGLGVVAAEMLVVLVATSLMRGLIGPRAWRLVHWLAYASWPIAVIHALGTGSDQQQPWLLGLTVGCVAAVLAALTHRLVGGGRRRTVPVRALAAAAALVATATACAWAVRGPLQPGWAARAGTPTTILSASTTLAPDATTREGFQDPLVGTLVRNARGGTAIGLRDTVDPDLTLAITPPGPSQDLPVVTVERDGSVVCSSPARATTSLYADCGGVRLIVELLGTPPTIGGTLTASGPLP